MAKKTTKSYDTTEPEAGEGYPLLKIGMMGKKGTATVICTGDVRSYDGDYGDGWFVAVKMAGKLYDLRVKRDSGNHARLKKIGSTMRALKGKKLDLVTKEFKGNEYIAIK